LNLKNYDGFWISLIKNRPGDLVWLANNLFLPPSALCQIKFHPCVYRDPVYFPGLASIIRECLFKTARIRSDVRNYKSDKDRPAIECLLIEKLAAPILELADRRLAHSAAVAVGKIEAPQFVYPFRFACVRSFQSGTGPVLDGQHESRKMPNAAAYWESFYFQGFCQL